MITEARIQDIEGIPHDHEHTHTIVLAGVVSIVYILLFCFVLFLWARGWR